MGFRTILSCFALLFAPVALAQDNATPALPPGTTSRPAQPERQGPEIEVFRDPVVPATPAPPPPVAPTVKPTVTPPPATNPVPARPEGGAPSPIAPTRRPVAPPPAADPAPLEPPAPAASPSVTPPVPAPAPAPAQRPVSPAPADQTPWGWIAAAVALLLGGVGAWRFLRPARSQPDAIETPAPNDVPPPRPGSPAPVATRARLSVALTVEAARLTFAGATVRYRLTLYNHGDAPAQDIMVHALLGSADAEQRALLQRFFAGTIGAPLHSVVAIDPGQTYALEGEVRMASDAIVPVTIRDHPLLIPLIAFDIHYRWGQGDVRSGRTGAAFIVGQEQDPPVDRLAPFRIDLGPRPFRRPGVRPAGEPLLA